MPQSLTQLYVHLILSVSTGIKGHRNHKSEGNQPFLPTSNHANSPDTPRTLNRMTALRIRGPARSSGYLLKWRQRLTKRRW